MKRLMISLLLLIGFASCSSMFQARYFHTSRTDYTFQEGTKIIEAKCDVEVRLCYENTQKACKGQYSIMYMTTKEIEFKWYTDRPCRRAGAFPERCETNGLGEYYPIREWNIEKYVEYTLTSKCR